MIYKQKAQKTRWSMRRVWFSVAQETKTLHPATHLDGVELGAAGSDVLGVLVGGLVDLQQPCGLGQGLQGVHGAGGPQPPLLQPLLQVADVTPDHTAHKAPGFSFTLLFICMNLPACTQANTLTHTHTHTNTWSRPHKHRQVYFVC